MLLKNYQKTAVKELLTASIKELGKWKRSSLVFKAPTGSGKTIMMQSLLADLSNTPMSEELCFVWISVNDLSRQSKASFEKNLEGTHLIFSEMKDVQDKELRQHEILFINWESIRSISRETGEWKVLAMKDNERDENLPTYLENTHEAGRKVVLIIDESQKSLGTTKAQELIENYLKPSLQIEVSATPLNTDYAQKIEVAIEDVIAQWMIKKEILVNEKLKELNPWDLETDRLILELALRKQQELRELYISEWSEVKPLLLIQLPSESLKTSELDITKQKRVEDILRSGYDISYENQKLAVWLSEDKNNKDFVDISNSPVEVLIFKQAIATGWDCPRAQILVMFREIKSFIFEIQTVGRILRMPEQHHYTHEWLNKAYVYTNLPKAEIGIGQTAKNLIKNLVWIRRDDIYQSFSLESFYKKRSDYKDLWQSFYRVLSETFVQKVWGEHREMAQDINYKKLASYQKFEIEHLDMTSSVLSDGKILVDIDHHTGERILAESEIVSCTEEELIKLTFDDFARNQVGPQFTNIARSYSTVIEGLYYTLDYYFFGKWYRRSFYQKLILKNIDFFTNLLNDAKDIYKPLRELEVLHRKHEAEEHYLWNIPTAQSFTERAIIKDYIKNILFPCYVASDSEREIWFIEEYLETSPEVVFWYKNSDNSKEFFAMPYTDKNGDIRSFYPDFIVQYKNGVIGIFDPKYGFTLDEWFQKAIGLEKYISEQNKKGKKLIWGLIEINQVSGTQTVTMLINTKWNYSLEHRQDFQAFSDSYILDYDFSETQNFSEEYLKQLERENEWRKVLLEQKQKEYENFIMQEKQSWDFDYLKREELLREIEELK